MGTKEGELVFNGYKEICHTTVGITLQTVYLKMVQIINFNVMGFFCFVFFHNRKKE